MLDAREVNALETRWEEYKRKKNAQLAKKIGAVAGAFAAVLLAIYLLNSYQKYQDKILEQNLAQLKVQKDVESLKQNVKKSELAQSQEGRIQPASQPAEPNSANSGDFLYMQESFDDSAKGKVSIQSKSIGSSIPNLISRFKSTGNVKYAILLAQEYYSKKDYKNAEKWSFTVNNLNKNLEEGWVVFAKSRYKMGKKEDAIMVLDTYRQKNPSKYIDFLITQIKSGTL